jgi:MFS family permease
VLRSSGFRRLYAVRISGQFTDGVFQFAMASYVFFSPERATGAPGVAAAFAALLLPYSLIGPFAGVLLDRWRRRQILFVANLIRAGLVVMVAAQFAIGTVGPGLFAVALCVLSVNRFILAGLSAALPHVVPRHELVMANAVSPTSGTIAATLGVGAAFLLRQLHSSDFVISLIAAVLYAATGLLALRLGRDQLGPPFTADRPPLLVALRRVAHGVAEGARHVRSRRAAAAALAMITVHRFFYGLATLAFILLARNYFNDPDDTDAGLATLSLVLGISGAGFLLSAWLTPIATRRMAKQTWALTMLTLGALVTVVPGGLFTESAVSVTAFGLGVTSQGLKIVVDTLVQENIDDRYRGRVFSFYDVLFNVAFVGAAAVGALTLPTTGRSLPVLVFIAAGYLAVAAAYRASLHKPG